MACPALIAACGGDEAAVEVAFEEQVPKVFRAIPPGNYVLRTQAQWDSLWMSSPAQFVSDPYPAVDKSTPVFDFQRFMLLVLSLGVGIRCNIPQIVRVYDQGLQRTVLWKTNEDTGITTLACLYQYPLITLALAPATSLDVQFTK